MDRIIIKGNGPLYGSIKISGAKNAVLPLMAAALLTKDTITLTNIPHLSDVMTMSQVLMNHGVDVRYKEETRSMQLNAAKITNYEAPYEIVRKMRASVLVLGPILARFGVARVSLPGGCAIGQRPIDLHLKALEELGAELRLCNGYVEAKVEGGLKGNEIHFKTISVGATENILMAASLAAGTTVLHGAAQEPEISDLIALLNKMGAKIRGEGTSILTIEGVSSLHGACHQVIPDRIEAATFAIAAAITGGELILQDACYKDFSNVAEKLKLTGMIIENLENNTILVKGNQSRKPLSIETGPYPNFPTDVQAQFMSLLSLSPGESLITENMFENRYMHVLELNRMGADISVQGNVATINGVDKLYGAEVMATDLRASVSLVLAGLAASGETIINRVYHIDRGYEKIEHKLRQCGAHILRVAE